MIARMFLPLFVAAVALPTAALAGSPDITALRADFFEAVGKHKSAMRIILSKNAGAGLKKLGARGDAAIADVKAACSGEFAALVTDPCEGCKHLDNPKAWCEAVMGAKEAAAEHQGRQAASALQSMVRNMHDLTAKLEREGAVLTSPIGTGLGDAAGLDERIAQFKAKHPAADLPDSAFTEYREAWAARWAEIARLAPTLERRPIKGHKAGPEAVAKRMVTDAGLQVLSSGLMRADWKIKLDVRKRPVLRSLPVVVMARAKGEDLCREIVASYVEQWDGSKYASPGNAGLGDWRFVSCPR